MSPARKFLLVDHTTRRYSAPDSLNYHDRRKAHDGVPKTRYSAADLSQLVETHTSSGSSLEFDTSNLSREMTPVSPSETSLFRQESYQTLSAALMLESGLVTVAHSVVHSLCSRSLWKSVILGQTLAVCLTIMQVINDMSHEFHDNYFPNGLNFPNYVLVTIVWTTQLAWRKGGRGIFDVMRLSGLRYVLLATLHVEAYFMTLSALQYDSYIGDQMIDCVASTLSLVLAYALLEIQFQLTHVVGFLIVMFGAVGLGIGDVNNKQDGDAGSVCLGDILRIGSGLFLAFNSLAQELIVKSIDSVEYLGMIGFFGSVICGVQTIVLEPSTLCPATWKCWSAIITYSVAQFIYTCLLPTMLRDVGTTGLHLCLVSTGFYFYVLRSFLYVGNFQILYLISFATIVAGTYVFTTRRTDIVKHYFFPVEITISKGEETT